MKNTKLSKSQINSRKRWNLIKDRVYAHHDMVKSVADRDGHICLYCGKDCPFDHEVDHIIPKSKGGTDDLENLTMSCKKCNREKLNKDLKVFLKEKGKTINNLKNMQTLLFKKKKVKKKVEPKGTIDVYTDGATLGFNGPLGTVKEVGLGIWIPQLKIGCKQRRRGISNNEAEFLALILAMKTCLYLFKKDCVNFYLDSTIVVNRANEARVKSKNKRMCDFQKTVVELKRQFKYCTFTWIPREKNWEADELSKEALI